MGDRFRLESAAGTPLTASPTAVQHGPATSHARDGLWRKRGAGPYVPYGFAEFPGLVGRSLTFSKRCGRNGARTCHREQSLGRVPPPRPVRETTPDDGRLGSILPAKIAPPVQLCARFATQYSAIRPSEYLASKVTEQNDQLFTRSPQRARLRRIIKSHPC